MKKYVLICCVLFSFKLFAQTNFNIYTELAQGASLYLRSDVFLDTDVNLGGQLNTSKGGFTVFAKYRYGNYIFTEVTPFSYRYHAVGLGFNYRLFVPQKKVSPFARIAVSTEIKPKRSTSEFELANYYSTSFFGEFLVGIDAQIVKNLNLNVGMGIGIREMRTNDSPPLYERSIANGLTAQLGVSYTFSVKRNKEIETD